MRCSAASVTGPSSSRSSLARGSLPTSEADSAADRTDTIRRTGSSSSRRSANSNAASDSGSSHWTSSIARTSSPSCARRRMTASTALATVLGAGAFPSSSCRSSATSSARRCGGVNASYVSAGTSASASPSAANESCASALAGLATRVVAPASRARRTNASQTVVLPMPGAPTIASPAKPPRRDKNAAPRSSSASRPTTDDTPRSLRITTWCFRRLRSHGSWVAPGDVLGCFAKLAHDLVAAVPLRNCLQLGKFVAGSDQELGRVGADMLVLEDGQWEKLGAAGVRALADEVEDMVVDSGLGRGRLDELVHGAEDRLVLG